MAVRRSARIPRTSRQNRIAITSTARALFSSARHPSPERPARKQATRTRARLLCVRPADTSQLEPVSIGHQSGNVCLWRPGERERTGNMSGLECRRIDKTDILEGMATFRGSDPQPSPNDW